jgi:putative glycosyltransferase (TIGR04348 family)
MGARVSVTDEWAGRYCDAMIALHAKKSSGSARAFAKAHPEKPLVVVLTGTDVYRDLARSKAAQGALDVAHAIVVLQADALRHLKASWRKKATAIVQSAVAPRARVRRHHGLNVLVLGHLRNEKDPMRAGMALQRIPRDLTIEVTQAGAALDARFARTAERLQSKDARYRYLGEVSHARALALLAASDVLVVSSRMEGGANVVSEAIAAGVPVIASRISGNVGLLGPKYPAYFAVADTSACARVLERCMQPAFLADLRRRMKALQPLVRPQREQRAVQILMKRLISY